LPSKAKKALVKHRARMEAEGLKTRKSDWVFCNSVGKPISAGNLTSRVFKPLITQAGVTPICFHELRHTFATIMLLNATHPKMVQEMLGHSHISVTMDTYSHVLPVMHHEAAQKLDEIFDTGTDAGPSLEA